MNFKISDKNKISYTIKFGVLLAFFLSFLVGCTTLRPPRSPVRTLTSLDEILRNIETREREIRDLKGIATVKVKSATEDYSFREVIIVQRPSSLRMEILGLFGQPVFFLTAKDDRLSVLSPAENTFYQGKVTPENLSIIFPFYLRPQDLFPILLGSVPLVDYVSIDIEFKGEEDLYLVKLVQEGETVRQILWVEPLDLSILKCEIYDYSEKPLLGIKFEGYKRVNGQLFPTSISISLPLSSAEIRVNYTDIEVNSGVGIDAFNLSVPPGVRIVNLD